MYVLPLQYVKSPNGEICSKFPLFRRDAWTDTPCSPESPPPPPKKRRRLLLKIKVNAFVFIFVDGVGGSNPMPEPKFPPPLLTLVFKCSYFDMYRGYILYVNHVCVHVCLDGVGGGNPMPEPREAPALLPAHRHHQLPTSRPSPAEELPPAQRTDSLPDLRPVRPLHRGQASRPGSSGRLCQRYALQ